MTKFSRYGSLNTHDLLKFVALIGMTVDHVGMYVFPEAAVAARDRTGRNTRMVFSGWIFSVLKTFFPLN